MPELPEAETIARRLDEVLSGRIVADVTVLREDVVAGPARRFARAIAAKQIQSVARRGKNVVLVLCDQSRVVINLGMTGRLFARAGDSDSFRDTASASGARGAPDGFEASQGAKASISGHAAVLFGLDSGEQLVYDDTRRFGRLAIMPSAEWSRWSRSLGPEPLSPSFTAKRLHRALARSRSPVRSLLLDQKKIAGVGNIYAIEALWEAEVHPRLPGRALSPQAAAKLHRSLRRVLRNAIRARGTTLRDYRTAEGAMGGFGPALRAYGKAGQPCRRCGRKIRRVVFSGRSAFFCPSCQGSGADLRGVHPMAVRAGADPDPRNRTPGAALL